MKINCPYCKKEFKAGEYTTVATCNHCYKSFRKKRDIPYSHDMGMPLAQMVGLAVDFSNADASSGCSSDAGSSSDSPSFDGGGGGDFGGGGASGDF